MERSFGLFFFLRKHAGSTVEGKIYCRITVDGKSVELSLKRTCSIGNWNSQAGRLNGRSDSVKSINAYLDTIQQKIYEAKRSLLEQGTIITPEAIKSFVLGEDKGKSAKKILEIFQQHNDQMKVLVGKQYAPGTLQRYEISLRHTQSFIKWRYKRMDLELHHLNYEFLSDYEFWLKSVRNCGHNSTVKYLANFRKIINRCIRHGWLQKDPFLGFEMRRREVERTALTEFELETLMRKVFDFDRLNQVRDIFLFSCFTGLSYADVEKLEQSDIITGVDGQPWIESKRQKTKITARIPLLKPAREILNKYSHKLQGRRLLPVLSNQKMNAYLKEISVLAGIDKNLTYHIARHTFATTVTLSNGVPIETVSKLLGHRTIRTTQHYAKLLDKKISTDMQILQGKY